MENTTKNDKVALSLAKTCFSLSAQTTAINKQGVRKLYKMKM